MFQFTHPGRGATWLRLRLTWAHNCFNSRTPGGVRLPHLHHKLDYNPVSIHAPREGCDCAEKLRRHDTYVSIHAPREGCDTGSAKATYGYKGFNSRTPGGVRRGHYGQHRRHDGVSIHAPREGCDSRSVQAALLICGFQFTHPGRGATM